ncbi:hypothetical protein BKA61DRAFT_676733 [Leptodontidium sp. MPI-SDFR-AT-0119]|nr:hypothetical protein BKA61DRAFT_676733 [Leptodontidium sp. MPI-SDFR-AT-0119]
MPRPAARASPGALENLAPELLIPILISLPDLKSLDNLLQASPAAFRLFNLRGVEIFEAILSSDVTRPHIYRALISITVLLRATTLPLYVYDLATFKDLVRHETTAYRYEPSRWDYPQSSLPSQTSPMILREVLATNRKILRLTLDCLQYYLDKFQPLRPSRLADRTFRYKAIFKDVKNFERPWLLNPAEAPYPVQTFESPSWIEQQRVIRALWRIRLFYEFKDAIGTSCILWPEKDISRAWTIGLKYFYDVPMYLPDGDGARLMEEDLCADSGPIPFEDTLLEDELVRSVLDYLAEDRDPMLESTYFQLKAAWEPPLVPPIQHERGWESLDTCHNSPMWRFFYLMSGPATQHKSDPMSPLQHVPFLPFRRLDWQSGADFV